MSEKPKYDRRKLINRIRELEDELRKLGVKPETEDLEKMSEDDLIEFGRATKEQLETKKKFLTRGK